MLSDLFFIVLLSIYLIRKSASLNTSRERWPRSFTRLLGFLLQNRNGGLPIRIANSKIAEENSVMRIRRFNAIVVESLYALGVQRRGSFLVPLGERSPSPSVEGVDDILMGSPVENET